MVSDMELQGRDIFRGARRGLGLRGPNFESHQASEW